MEKFNEWTKTCLRKKRLKEGWADDIIKRSKTPLTKYYCNHCFGWHVTSKLKA